ncbi:ISSod13, transposase [Wolbachia endosymbiont of Armadillidium vulgare str. wVulC]|nr:ISSod13, transposase [Wolbachia endosymbiont of Armadillidium vulgare str. wVulC]
MAYARDFIEDECYNIIFRKKIYSSLEDLQIDVDHWLPLLTML